MSKKNVLPIGLVIILLTLVSPGFIFNQGNERIGFTTPLKGDTIVNRKDFVVSLEISNFDKKTGHHWVAIASVTGHNKKWERVLGLYRESRGKHNAARTEMDKILSEWQIDQFWPKFYVPEKNYENRVFDGGSNPLKGLEPQPMILLIIKVDDRMQNNFRQWFKRGAAGNGYPGYPASILSENMVLARCEIFFP
jgi:hypothetical protein